MNIKRIVLVALAIMMVSTVAMTAMAADQIKDQKKLKDGTCLYTDTESLFVDVDGDGVCDNYVDGDGDGICDNCQGTGDGDGIPDRLQDGSCDSDCDGDGPDRIQKKDGSCQA